MGCVQGASSALRTLQDALCCLPTHSGTVKLLKQELKMRKCLSEKINIMYGEQLTNLKT